MLSESSAAGEQPSFSETGSQDWLPFFFARCVEGRSHTISSHSDLAYLSQEIVLRARRCCCVSLPLNGLTQDNKMAMKGKSVLGAILAFLATRQCLCIRPKVGREDKVIGWSEK